MEQIQKLIEKYEVELESLKQERRHNREWGNGKCESFNSGEIFQVLEIIQDLKNLNGDTEKRVANCGAPKNKKPCMGEHNGKCIANAHCSYKQFT